MARLWPGTDRSGQGLFSKTQGTVSLCGQIFTCLILPPQVPDRLPLDPEVFWLLRFLKQPQSHQAEWKCAEPRGDSDERSG